MNVYRKKEEQRSKELIQLAYLQSAMTSQFIGKSLCGKKIPELYQLFPGAFKPKEPDWGNYEQQFLNFARQHNKQREVTK